MDIGILPIAAISVICYLITEAVKLTSLDKKWLPVIAGTMGGIIAIPAMYTLPDFPVHDPISAIAVGIVSGLAATGVNQIYKQLTKTDSNNK